MVSTEGFSIVELLLVTVIIGILLVVIIPKAIRANIDAKYGVVRQNCSELASFATQWVQKSIHAQDENRSTATIVDYFATLAGEHQAPRSLAAAAAGQWVAIQGQANNWNLGGKGNLDTHQFATISGRWMGGKKNAVPEDVVESIIPTDKVIRNPFNKENIFRAANDPATMAHSIAGAIALGGVVGPEGFVYYGFCFQGKDTQAFELFDPGSFLGEQELQTIQGLRNGMFLARVR